ncbi:DUF4197 domain-containing protein [Pedobacter heparinus]|uniref:DUF4197 domain-containing protein n=1 Tax=Pedobacter heparinus (strain ATCC 13125 / DSM 2366 / CIP 104194 / JCM 7457 / NBRC 12017 / NCIMB 9290 / NRRL B-14731 / HIM 762-3) TaxID=485917 RepID=C6XYE5_PEDHD|nr:DUF4197 domain-containing protein [Pedobacter heparinus]ACU02412.1 conserved hypothetical protein [Pedobacter heparinus DSM 2366]
MKKKFLYLALTAGLTFPVLQAQSQIKIGNILKQVTGKGSGTTATTGTPSALEIGMGIKEALEIGTSRGADLLSAKDGFLGNMAVKILFPPEAQKVEKTLRSIGMGKLADNVIVSLNRAAESAAKEAKPIFISAIKQMTITDATNILLGSKDAATNYFKRVTTAQLMEKFKPVITTSLANVGATKYWGQAAGQYNKIPLMKPVNTDLSEYVAQKAIDGMFIQVAQEELKIRDNLGARSSSLLQKVFGYADKNK